MKFVHLTPQPSISRVKRSGIRTGHGRRGRGVYAVPLMLLPQVAYIDDETFVAADPRSSTTLWTWLASLRCRHRNLAVVTFRTTPDHWPADLYIELKAGVGTDWLSTVDPELAFIAEEDLQFVRKAHSQGFVADLKLSVRNEAALGKILHTVQSHGFGTLDQYDESIEIIFSSLIPSKLIDRVTPLYRTNINFKESRDQDRDIGN